MGPDIRVEQITDLGDRALIRLRWVILSRPPALPQCSQGTLGTSRPPPVLVQLSERVSVKLRETSINGRSSAPLQPERFRDVHGVPDRPIRSLEPRVQDRPPRAPFRS